MCGVADVDVDDWRKNTIYRGEYYDQHTTIQWFWKVSKTQTILPTGSPGKSTLVNSAPFRHVRSSYAICSKLRMRQNEVELPNCSFLGYLCFYCDVFSVTFSLEYNVLHEQL